MNKNEATKYIEKYCNKFEKFKEAVFRLDQYDLTPFLSDGLSIQILRDKIEEKYDKIFWEKYHEYVFDQFDSYDFCKYLESRYDIRCQEYTDWVVRKINGINI